MLKKSKLYNNFLSNIFFDFYKDKNGNIAIIFALSIIPIIGAIGLSVDYSRASYSEATMQTASDAGALAAAIDVTLSYEQKQQLALNAVQVAMIQKPWIKYDPSSINLVVDSNGGHTVSFNASLDTSLIGVFGYKTLNLQTSATAVAGSEKTLEIAIALDNTGSMHNDMVSLRSSATNFISTLFQKAPKGKLKIGLVPFVASVNPGKKYIDNADMSDYYRQSSAHGFMLSQVYMRNIIGCNNAPQPPGNPLPPDTSPQPPTTPVGPGKGGGSDKKQTWLNQMFGSAGAKFAYVSQEIFGVKSARAQSSGGTMPATDYVTMSNTWHDFDYTDPSGAVLHLKIPGRYNDETQFHIDGCTFVGPNANHFDLFKRIPGASWKGCVEARPNPYDVNDEAPNNTDPKSKFVPYFWPSEPALNGVVNEPGSLNSNNYILNLPASGQDYFLQSGYQQPDNQNSMYDLAKYNGTNNGGTVAIQENGPDTMGPNKACPNEVTPLTDDLTLLKAEIGKLVHWYGGGTVTSEGLMWAWRVLSPNLPYATAQPYDPSKVKKYIVLMSDGVNDVQDNGARDTGGYPTTAIVSDYTAYGALWSGRGFAPWINSGWTINNFNDARTALNERFQTACTNAKAKGITVYTIYFREDDPVAIDYLKMCSGSNNFYKAADANQLRAAFSKIAQEIYAVRLSK